MVVLCLTDPIAKWAKCVERWREFLRECGSFVRSFVAKPQPKLGTYTWED